MSVRAKHITFDCLMPTGLLLQATVSTKGSFLAVKKELWKVAKKMPFYAVLKEQSSYGLSCVSVSGTILELRDDELVTRPMYQPLLNLIERKGSKEEQIFNMRIGMLISKRLSEFDSMRDDEVNAFRRDILTVCKEAVKRRHEGGEEAYALHQFPPSIVLKPLPKAGEKKMGEFVLVRIINEVEDVHPKETTLKANVKQTPRDLIELALRKLHGKKSSNPDDYVLKVHYKEEYLLGNYLLHQYKYVRDCLRRSFEKMDISDIQTVLVLQPRKILSQNVVRPDQGTVSSLLSYRPQVEDPRPLNTRSMWDPEYGENDFKITIRNAENCIKDRLFGMCVEAGIYLGDMPLCKPERTRILTASESPDWGQELKFNMKVKDIPRNARLCLSLFGLFGNPLKVRPKKTVRNDFPMSWVNVSILDYRRCLRMGEMHLVTKQYEEQEPELLNPLGSCVPSDQTNLPILHIAFDEYRGVTLEFPDNRMIGGKEDGRVDQVAGAKLMEMKQVEPIIKRHPLHKFSDSETGLVRKFKYYFKEKPEALAKVLRTIDWSRNMASHEVKDALAVWAKIQPEEALQLLDAGFAEEMIRSHAVRCLEPLSDDELLQYLMQLVQVLKYESYLDCDLARFLLKRALASQRIGHFFFWHLKSEMHVQEVKVRYGLLLEAYCRGCGSHMDQLVMQDEALKGIEKTTELIKNKAVKDKKSFASEKLAGSEYKPFQLPLDPSVRLGPPTVRKVFDSAQKPMWVQFESLAPGGPESHVMFKCGDDLRQDMLTLQLIRLMDQLWTDAGLNMQMSAYDCLATGDEVGMLEMVTGSATLWKIQGKVKNVLWADDVLYKWIMAKNEPGGPEAQERACNNFMLSCAGYSVATYVLGIADRHNDNIMVKETGQLFHIDFGHFLGNWKSKFGIKRERVKFILTPDFAYTITRGEGQKSERWQHFKEACRECYLLVRRRADLFINLLNMMLSTGIPELKSHKDVDYLVDTLCLDMSDEVEAGEHFMNEIDLALKDSKSVRINWAFHGVKHG